MIHYSEISASSEFNFLTNKGFKLSFDRTYPAAFAKGEKLTPELHKVILLGFDSVYPEDTTPSHLCAYIGFPKTDKMISTILSENNLKGISSESTPTYDISVSFEEYILDFKEKHDSLLNQWAFTLEHFLENQADSFFDKYGSLNFLHSHVMSLKAKEELSSFLGPLWEFRRIAIMSLAGDVQTKTIAKDFLQKRKSICESYPEEEVAINYYNAAKQLHKLVIS